jgi:dihydropyrimidinase
MPDASAAAPPPERRGGAGRLLVVGGTVVDVDGERRADVRIGRDGRVAELGPALTPQPGEDVVDATGMLVVPGGVDAHTHLHLPLGAVAASDDFDSGTRAAAIGGTTTVLEYVTAYRGEDPFASLEHWRRLAAPTVVDVGFHMTFTERVPEATVAGCIERGVTSFKLYMAYPETLQVDDDVILDVMTAAARHGGLVTIHAENGGAITALRRQALEQGRTGVVEHARTRPAVLEGEATARAATLAEVAGAAVYIVHMSSAPALAAVRSAQERGVAVLAETCPQYLYLDVDRLAGPDGDNFVCTPPLRDPWHGEELWHGLAAGWLHTVATDHCPFWVHDRKAGMRGRDTGWADFTEIPGGLPGIETRMALVWDGVRAGKLTRADWIRLCCEAPARLFGLWPRKGSLRVGSDGDVVVWDPARRQSLDAAALHMRTDHSPYAGVVATGWPSVVAVRGTIVARDGACVAEPGTGLLLDRAPVRAEDLVVG